jgi:P-type Cu+ transporter
MKRSAQSWSGALYRSSLQLSGLDSYSMDTQNVQLAPVEKDLVCGMTVEPARAKATQEHGGKMYYFCCAGCAEKFRADPGKYLAPKPLVGIAPASSSPVQISPARVPSAQVNGTQIAPATRSPMARTNDSFEYTCPMDPDVRQQGPGECPKCGMDLESVVPVMPSTKTEYTCPMHSEVVRDQPGNCPICGMALEPRTITAEEEMSPELDAMSWRFWICVGLTVPVLLVAMSDAVPGLS